MDEGDCLGWSPDGRALALASGPTVLAWRQGRPPHQFERLPAVEGGYYDRVIDFVWSPDGRRVLFRLYQLVQRSNVERLANDARSHLWSCP